MLTTIRVRGARQHNLKDINVDIPKNQFVVVTGVSGSGKSSFAFDTVYAEGQRRYVESLSAYARQFLGVMDKPDVDMIEGLSPSISIDQKTVSHNPRSTVGTITEIYDYLRVLFARIGTPHCPHDGSKITRLTVDQITDQVIDEMTRVCATIKIAPHRFIILSPIVRDRKGEYIDLFDNLREKGYREVIVDDELRSLEDDIPLIKTNKHTILVKIDEISVAHRDMRQTHYVDTLRPRLNQSIEQSLKLSDGLSILRYVDPDVSSPDQPSMKSASHRSHSMRDHLYSEKFACAQCGFSLSELEPRMFSFNSPLGACESCKGLGVVHRVDPDLLFAPKLSINEGGILPFTKLFFTETWYTRLIKAVFTAEGVDMVKPIADLTREQIDTILYGTKKTYRVTGQNRFGRDTTIHEKFDGIVSEIERRYYSSSGGSEDGWHDAGRYMREEVCKTCNGDKLKPEVLAVTIDDQNIAKIQELAVSELSAYYQTDLPAMLNSYETQIAKPVLKEIITRLRFLQDVGLGYLTLSRKGKTLSGGELQRIRLASQIGTGLTGVLYVLDEPSIGLHPRDVSALISTLKHLRDIGNTLIIVEHDEETIRSADHLIELGPGAGKHGGEVTFTGSIPQITRSRSSLTGSYLSGKKSVSAPVHDLQTSKGEITLRDADQFNLKHVTLTLPLGNLIGITGVSGSGKSTIITETLYPALRYHLDGHFSGFSGSYTKLEGFHYVDRVYLVDQSPIGRTPRSNPATYIGFFDAIREVFSNTADAKARGYDKGRFSFNVKGGRCEKCQGAGMIKIEMQFLSDVYITCDVCNGHRYNRETLEVRFKDKSIFDILKMTVDEASEFFVNFHQIHPKLLFLQEVGLGYIELGQAAPTFSGGEAQRIKLALELSRGGQGRTLYILDEPTTGLHFADVQKLLTALAKLVHHGNTVIVIEHNLDIIRHCQYIVDMGPEGGDGGGQILYQGPLAGLREVSTSHTSRFLYPPVRG